MGRGDHCAVYMCNNDRRCQDSQGALPELNKPRDGKSSSEKLDQCVSDFLHLFCLKRDRMCEIIRELLQVPAEIKRITERKQRAQRVATVASAFGLVAGVVAIPLTPFSSVVSCVAVVVGISAVMGLHAVHNKAMRKEYGTLRALGEEFVTAAAGLKERVDGLNLALTEGLWEPCEDINIQELQTKTKKSLTHFDRLTADVTVVSILVDTDHFSKTVKAMEELRPILEQILKHFQKNQTGQMVHLHSEI